MSNIYVVTYSWKEALYNPESDGDSFFLEASVPGFPIGQVDTFSDDYAKQYDFKKYQARVWLFEYEYNGLPPTATEEDHEFDTLDDAKQFCEYKLLGAEAPASLKIEEVEEKLDGVDLGSV